MITIEHLHHHIGTTPILTDINLHLHGPGITALIGPNGAGKSTLLHLIARLLPLQQGRVLLDGQDIHRLPGQHVARRLAILTQDNPIHSRLTVQDLLLFGRHPHNHGHESDEDRTIVHETLARFDLQPLATRPLDALSGGQRQRALIAMAFCQQTPHILLDEPLNNLDMYHARTLMRLLRRLTDEQNLTTLIVVHDINIAAAWADRIIALKDGHIAADGSPAETITAANLQAIFNLDAEVLTHRGLPLVVHHI